MKKIKCILDTDVGDDIDDTWAILMMLLSAEIEPILITTCWGDTTYRAKIIAKLLSSLKCTHIPIGVGVPTKPSHPQAQENWVRDYDLSTYEGTIHPNGVEAIVKSIMNESEIVTLICIGPLTNIAAAIKSEPKIVDKAKFVGMLGSVRKGYLGMSKVIAEHNVRMDIPAAQFVFNTTWPHGLSFTPVDSSGLVRLEGAKYEKLSKSETPVVKLLLENYKIWLESRHNIPNGGEIKESSILFDTVAIYMAYSTKLLKMEQLPILITDDGFTAIDVTGKANQVQVATGWKDLSAFNHMLVERLQKNIVSKL